MRPKSPFVLFGVCLPAEPAPGFSMGSYTTNTVSATIGQVDFSHSELSDLSAPNAHEAERSHADLPMDLLAKN